MTYSKLNTIDKLNNYRKMYLKAQDYKSDSIDSLKLIEPNFFDFINMYEYRQNRVLTYQKIQDRIEQRINNLIKELKTQ